MRRVLCLCVGVQKDLEVHDGVSAGKYTLGLGQENLGFCGDNEDVISMRSGLCLDGKKKGNKTHGGASVYSIVFWFKGAGELVRSPLTHL